MADSWGTNDKIVNDSGADFGANDPIDKKPAGALRRLADTGLALAKGVVGVPEAAVGVADLVTGGRAGKAVESAGIRFKDAKDTLDTFRSPEQQAADEEVAKAEGFFPTVGAMLKNPSTIVNSAVESAPSMIGGGAVSRGALGALRYVAPKTAARIGAAEAAPFVASPASRSAAEFAPIAAGALGEGVTAAGQNAEQVRQEDPNGLLTNQQAGILAASGLATGGISLGAGKLANKLGIGDVQTMMASGKLGPVGAEATQAAAKKGAIRKIGEGFATEGVLQELPQSAQEQAAQNIAQGKPWDEGVAKAGAQGMLAGGVMGMGGSGISHLADQIPMTKESNVPPMDLPPPEVPPVAPAGSPTGNSGSDLLNGQMGSFGGANALMSSMPASQAMGINPAGGPLQAAAAMAVDSGAHDVEIAKQAAMVATDTAPPDGTEEKSIDFAKSQNQPISGENAAISGQSSLISQIDSGINPATGEIVSAFDQREADRPKALPTDILRVDGTPFTNIIQAKKAAREAGEGWAPFKLDKGVFVVRQQEATNPQTQTAAPDTAPAPSGQANEVQPAKSDSADTTGGTEQPNGALAEVGRAQGTPRATTATTNPQPTTLGTQTSAKAGPGFSAKDVPSVKNPAPAANDTQTQAAPDAAPQAVGADTDAAGPTPGAGSTPVESDGVSLGERAIREQASVATSGYDTEKKLRFADFAESLAGQSKEAIQKAIVNSEFGTGLAVNELDGVSKSIAESASLVAGQARKNAAPKAESTPAQKLENQIKFQKLRLEQASDAIRSATDTDRFGLPVENGPKKQSAIKRHADAQQKLSELERELSEIGKQDASAANRAKLKAKNTPTVKEPSTVQPDSQPPKEPNGTQADKAQPKQTQQQEAPAATGVEVSRFNGKFKKGMNKGAAHLEAIRLNKTNDGITYTAEEHNDAKLENPYAVVGRKVSAQISQPVNQVQALADTGQVAIESVAPEKKAKKPAGGKTLRATAYDRNPLLTFLATHGLFHDKDKPNSHKAEFSPDKGIMVMGYGPIFKKTGKRLDVLTHTAIEEGYLPKDGTESQLRELVRRAIAGEKISPVYAQGVAEQLAEQSYAEHLAQQQEAAQNEDFDDPFTPMLDGDFEADDFNVPGYSEASDPIKVEVNALLALAEDHGIDTDAIKGQAANDTYNDSEQAYYEATRDALKAAIEGSGRNSNQDSGAQGNAGSEEGLTSPTRADVLKQQADAEAEAKRKEDGGDKPLPRRELTGDVPDMFNTQGSVFDQPAEAPAETPSTYINGDRAEYTGKTETLHGGLFYEVRFTEGRKKGETAVTQRAPDGTNPIQSGPVASSGIVTPQVPTLRDAERFAIGKSLTKEQRKDVLKTLVDVYKAKGAPKESKGLDQNGDERVGYAYSPELFEKSDITGAMVRYHVTLPDGRIAHPSELFEGYTQNDINNEIERKNNAEKRNREIAKGQYLDDQFDTKREAADYWNDKSDKSMRTVNGKPTVYDALERTFITDGKKFAMIPTDVLKNQDMMDAIHSEGWREEPEGSAPTSSKPSAPIADFGEKIGGAKKDTWTGFKDKMAAVSDDDIANRKLSEIWPAPDYQKMIDDGMDAKSVALIRSIRDEVPSKPRTGYKLKRWAEQVKEGRALALGILNEKNKGDTLYNELTRIGGKLSSIAGRADLYMAVGHEKSLEGIRLAHHHYSLYRGRENVNLWVAERDASATAFSNWPQELATGDTKEDAIAAFKARYAELDAIASVRKADYVIFTKSDQKAVFIGKKIGRNVAELAGPFATLKEARDYRAANLKELDAKLEKYKEIPKERRDTNEPRVGEDMRNGLDVTPEMFAESFGFKGVEFGNWVEQKRRQKDLNDAFDALMDMAAIMGVPAKAMSLNGELGLAFGARGSGGVNPAAAHYESDKVVINLTKKEGAGSLGHEWWHALDNHFSKMRGNRSSPYMTTATDVSLASRGSDYMAYPGVRKEMIDAFGEVVKSIRMTAIKARSSKMDAKRTKEYWTTGEEMAARAFESYLISKLHDQNASNDYLANVVDQKTWDAMAALGMENEDSYPYPTAGEMPVIRAGFDKFFQTLETKETDKGVAMFSRGAQTQATAKVQPIVDAIKAGWKNAPPIVVAFDLQDPRIPERVRQEDLKQRSGGAAGTPEGFYYKGTVYLMSSKVKTANDVARVLAHETLGHYGLRGMFGDALTPILRQIAHMRKDQVRAKAIQYGLKGITDLDRRTAAEEVLAEMAQNTPEIGFVRRAIAAIRTWLRRNVPGFKSIGMTDDEIIRSYIIPARNWVERGAKAETATGMVPAFGRESISSLDSATVKRIGDKWAAVRFEGTGNESHISYHATEQQARDAATANDSKRRLEADTRAGKFAGWWTVDGGTQSFRDESIRGNDAVATGRAIRQTLDSRVRAVKTTAEGRNLQQIPSREGFCYKCAAEAAMSGIGDYVIGESHDGTNPVWHAVIMRDGMVYDPTFGKWFAPGIYEKLGFKEALRLTPQQVRDYLDQTGGLHPNARNQGLGDAPGDVPMFSRSVGETLNTAANSVKINKVVDALSQHFGHPGKLSWWDKTVGSPYNLAERSPAFKKVFNSAQNFINDVSFYATEAADFAPKILPKLENMRDVFKSPITAADNRMVAAPVFEGTLEWARDESGKPVRLDELETRYADLSDEEKAGMLLRKRIVTEDQLKRWQASPLDIYHGAIRNRFEATFLKAGVLWSDAELASIFKLNADQIGLYKEFRTATDKSLDNLAKADMIRYGGKDSVDMQDMVMDAATADDAAILLRDHFLTLADENPERADSLRVTANGMVERADKVSKLKAEGYAPLSRFGRYSVDVVVNGERQYFSLFETAADANRMAKKMGATFGAGNVAQGTMSQKEFELFQGITPESLELFGNMLGLDSTGDQAQDKVFQTYLQLTKNNRSAMKRLIHRKGIAGYSEDIGRVLSAFVYSNARQTSAALNMGAMGEAVNDIPKGQGELKDAAINLSQYIKQPREEAQALRGLLFAQYLGGSVASAFVNSTQPFTVSMPYLSQFGGAAKATSALFGAMRDMKTKKTLEPELAHALKIAEEKGIVAPQEVHQLQAQARGAATLTASDGTHMGDVRAFAGNSLSKLALGWGKLFGLMEHINRKATYIAAFRMGVENKVADPAAFAEKAVNETQFINNKANKAQWARGPVGATLMTFKSYSINYLELLHRMATQNGPEGKKAAALAIGMLILMAGAGGLPFEDDLEDAIDFILQRLGYNLATKKLKQEFLEDLFGKTGAQFVDKGLTGLPGSPIDVSGRMSMGNLIPGTGLLLQKTDHTRDVAELFGAAGDLVMRGFKAADNLASGELKQAALSIAPKAVSNAFQGADMAQSGIYKDAKGYKVIDATPMESAMKAIGFQPASVAKVQESNYLNQRAKDFYNLHAAEIRSRWAKGIFENDPDQVEKAREMMQTWNDQNPGQRIQPNMMAVMRKVREMRKDKEQRIADTAPKAMRATLRQEIAERRAMQ